MVAQKPVVYPNLGDSMLAAVDAYEAVHDAVSTHAEEHRRVLADRRKALEIKQQAAALIAADAKKSTNNTGS